MVQKDIVALELTKALLAVKPEIFDDKNPDNRREAISDLIDLYREVYDMVDTTMV